LVSKADVGRHAREVALTVGQALERRADPQAHPVPSDRVASSGAKNTAEVRRRDAQRGGQVAQRTVRV
jgi:hypothetical protein